MGKYVNQVKSQPAPSAPAVRSPTRAIVRLKRDQAVRRALRRKFEECHWLQPFDRETVEQWATARRRRLEIEQILRVEGIRLPDGTPHPLLSEARHWDARETALSDRLGFNPKARLEIRASGKRAPLDLVGAMDAEVVENDGPK
jgi:hypothetical protein